MKYLFKILSSVIILSSCANPIVEIPIEDIHAHRLFINSNEYSDDELFSVYEELYSNNENLKNEPYIYYFLSRFESERAYLDEGLNKFPDDPFINFNRNRYLNENDEARLYLEILENHPRFNMAMHNYLNLNKDLIEIFLGSSTKEILENDTGSNTSFNEFEENFAELEYGYKNGDPVSSEFHNFKDSNYGLEDNQVELIEKSFQNIISIVKTVNVALESCSDKEASLRSFERDRIGKMSYMRFIDQPDAVYIGNCKYKVVNNVLDEMYYSQYNIIMTYYYNYGSWERVSSDMYKAINGRWVKQ